MYSFVNRAVFAVFLLAGAAWAQNGVMRNNFEVGGGGVFPLSGYKAEEYSAGPAWHAGYELRPIRALGAEAGYTGAGLPGTACDKFGCTYPRETVKLLDYGLRGHVLLDDGRIDLSAGVGGGYVWYEGYNPFANGPL